MKVKLSTNLIVNVVVIGFVIIMAASKVMPYIILDSPPRDIIDVTTSDKVKTIDAKIPDTMNYWDYKKMKDSIVRMRKVKNGIARGTGIISVSNSFIGTAGRFGCDTCSLQWAQNNFQDKKHIQYYLLLPGWKLRAAKPLWGFDYDDSVKFYVEHGQSYIRKIINTYTKTKDNSIYHTSKIKDIPVKFKYDEEEKYIMIPVSSSTKHIMDFVVGFIAIADILYLLYLLTAFLKFTIDVSKGLAFTDQNIKRLKLIAISLILLPILFFLLNLLMKLIFRDYFTADVVINFDTWKESWKGILIGMLFLLLFKAFRQGKILKDEQDLTV